ncbi:MAG: aspartate/glutamate racemase family protein, partial [Propionibacteriaceae bacterium]|nr:aspartate/glutamate racemase family protein [Propionibacteriaceae bacterium]
MKTIGILGGMSLESTLTYVAELNRIVNQALGGLHSPKLVVYSVDFDEIERMQALGEWERAGQVLHDAAKGLEAARADFIIMATNTMHKVAPAITEGLGIPFLHIGTATGEALARDGVTAVGLLGTRFTMEEPFYREVIESFGIKVVVPDAADRATVNAIIYDELCKGVVKDSSAAEFQRVIAALASQGAQAVVLGCTEIGMLVKTASLPSYDTTLIHVAAAAAIAL